MRFVIFPEIRKMATKRKASSLEEGQDVEEGQKTSTTVKQGTSQLSQLSMPGVFLINSKSQGGKSHLLHCTMYQNRKKFKWGVGFSQSSFNEENLSYIHPRFKHLRYDPAVLREVLVQQAKVPKPERPLVFIIFDDCITDIHQDDKVLKEAVTQTFHYNICIVITTQSINALPTWVRENAFQVALFKNFTEGAIEAAYKSYGQDFDNVKQFKHNVNNKLGEHVFAFSDRHAKGQWLFLKCPPPPLPKFMLRFGEEKKKKSKKRPKKKRRYRK